MAAGRLHEIVRAIGGTRRGQLKREKVESRDAFKIAGITGKDGIFEFQRARSNDEIG
jgi:hypothetical protein